MSAITSSHGNAEPRTYGLLKNMLIRAMARAADGTGSLALNLGIIETVFATEYQETLEEYLVGLGHSASNSSVAFLRSLERICDVATSPDGVVEVCLKESLYRRWNSSIRIDQIVYAKYKPESRSFKRAKVVGVRSEVQGEYILKFDTFDDLVLVPRARIISDGSHDNNLLSIATRHRLFTPSSHDEEWQRVVSDCVKYRAHLPAGPIKRQLNCIVHRDDPNPHRYGCNQYVRNASLAEAKHWVDKAAASFRRTWPRTRSG